jgi:serine protease inhibitor
MGKTTFWLLFAALLLCQQCCVQEAHSLDYTTTSEYVRNAAERNNLFAFKLFRQLSYAQQENICISPKGISTVLRMMLNGAAGNTRDQIAAVLNASGETADELNREYEHINSVHQSMELRSANSLWCDSKYKLLGRFTDTCKNVYDADAYSIPFDSPKSVHAINQWVKKLTDGKIAQIITELEKHHFLLLVNATYFKAAWEDEFNPSATKTMKFMKSNASTKRVRMMHKESMFFSYGHADDLQIIALPYKGFSYTMFVLLPEKHSTLASQLALLTTDRWAAIKSTIKGRRGELFLPKFEFDFDSSLSDTLQQLGMKDCFDLKKADFSATLDTADKTLPEPACLDDVIQKTTIRVDEYGTEAASSVAGAYYIAGGPREEQPFVMKVDHPFLFVLEDNLTREIVFVGKVEDP